MKLRASARHTSVMIASLAALVLAPALVQTAYPDPSILSKPIVATEAGQRIDDYMKRIEGFGYMGTLLVLKDKQVIVNKAYGYADREKQIPMELGSVFDIASLAKQFTATAILKLEAAGKLSVSDSIEKHLEGVPESLRGVTIHNLLGHRGGVGRTFDLFDDATKEQALQRIFAAKTFFKPGERFQYSNEGYVLLAAVIEAASKRRYQDYIVEEIFKPAGMTTSGFWGKRMPKVPQRLIAEGHDESSIVTRLERLNGDNWADLGGGQLVTNLQDLYRWFLAFENNKILTQEQKERMLTPGQPPQPSEFYGGESYGYAWFVQKRLNGHRRWVHGGDSIAHGCELIILPDDDIVVINLCNLRLDMHPTSIRGARVPPLIALGEKHIAPPFFSTERVEDHHLLGKYRADGGAEFEIWRDSMGLQIGARNQDAVDVLDPVADDATTARRQLNASFVEATNKLLGGDNQAWVPFNGRERYATGAVEEIKTMGKALGNVQSVTSFGAYTGGFWEVTMVLQVKYERGELPYKINMAGGTDIATTWTNSPSCSSPMVLQPVSKDRWVGWGIVARKPVRVQWMGGGKIQVEGRTKSALAARQP